VKRMELSKLWKRTGALIAVFCIICFCLTAIRSEPSYAKDITASPFKSLKIGSKNIVKYTKKCWMTDGLLDGCIEVPIGDVKGKVKNGSRIKYKLKKGFKMKAAFYLTPKGKKRIKNNQKISGWKSSYGVAMVVKKGKYRTYFLFLPQTKKAYYGD